MSAGGKRIDQLLVERGFFPSRARAQEAIAAGLVSADGKTIAKPSAAIAANASILAADPHPFVSRGGVKLAYALDHFGVDPAGRVCLDIGASTGGFTDVLLRRGAALVHAVDVGHAQLHPRLVAEPQVRLRERCDARGLTPNEFAEAPTLVTLDVSFISLTRLLAPVLACADPCADAVMLIKPQFEAGRRHVKKGVVRDEAVHRAVCDDVARTLRALGWEVAGIAASPIAGGDGNREFLLAARRAAA